MDGKHKSLLCKNPTPAFTGGLTYSVLIGIHEGIDVPKSFDNDPPSYHSTRLKGIRPFNGYCVCYTQLILPR